MRWWDNLVRRARLRGLVEGKVQRGRAESLDDDAKDDCERWQDYGFSAQPVDGQGLVINAGGHTIVLRMDRIAERPQLAAYEVSVWHREGHRVTLRAGRVVDVDCDELTIAAATRVSITSPTVEIIASTGMTVTTPQLAASTVVSSPTITAATSLTVQGKQMHQHRHTGVATGSGTSGPPQ